VKRSRMGRISVLACLLMAFAVAPVAPQSNADRRSPFAPGGGPKVDEAERLSGESEPSSSMLELQKSSIAASQAGPVDPERYVLGPGDVLQLELWGRVARTTVLNVSPDGKIFLAGSGPLQVAGQTLRWAQDHVNRLVSEAFQGVHADLRLVRLRVFRIYATGFVNRAGAIDVTPVTRASEAIAGVGIASGGSRRNIEIRRRDGTRLRVDLDLFELGGRLDLDPPLQDGDIIAVPHASRFVDLTGAIVNSRRFELVDGDSLATLLRLAGGLLPSASRDQALLMRFRAPTVRESVWLDVRALESGQANPELRDGDDLFVFYISGFHELHSVAIYGEVMRPGAYPITLDQDHLTDLIRWAGGFRAIANRSAIYLLRAPDRASENDPVFERLGRLSREEMTESEYAAFRTKVAQRANSFRVDFDRLQGRKSGIDPLLQPGDVVRVDPLLLSVRVDGEVRRPGLVDYVKGRSARQYIQFAGGFTDRAAGDKVRVSRSVTGQVIKAHIGEQIEPGDFIWVPEQHDVDARRLLLDVMTIVSQAVIIVVATRR